MTFRLTPARPAGLVIGLLLCLAAGPGAAVAAAPAAEPPVDAKPADVKASLFHAPGIAGEHVIDRELIRGLRRGGFDGTTEIHDWTEDHRGIAALYGRKRHRAQARLLAEKIEERRREQPGGRVVLTGHSGGSGIVVWALENLPDDVLVDDVLLLAPALSPGYDLSKALKHVRGKMYAFTSPNDVIVLGFGTQLFTTIDGQKGDAAGRVGFTCPVDADAAAYEKLVPMPYDKAWMKLGNIGDHIGVMSARFAERVLTPLISAGPAAKTDPDPPAPAAAEKRAAPVAPERAPEPAAGR